MHFADPYQLHFWASLCPFLCLCSLCLNPCRCHLLWCKYSLYSFLCWRYIEPLPEEEAEKKFQFENMMIGQAVPSQFIQAIEKGFIEAKNSWVPWYYSIFLLYSFCCFVNCLIIVTVCVWEQCLFPHGPLMWLLDYQPEDVLC
jgi:hypothetical protein